MPDVGGVMGSLHRERLNLVVDGVTQSLPGWADWLVWLGAWMRGQAGLEGKRVVVVVLPTRRLAGAFVALGSLLIAARLHDDSLDWESLQALPSGAQVNWRDTKGGKATSYSGNVLGVRDLYGSQVLAVAVQSPLKYKGSTYFLPRASALSYGVTQGAVTSRGQDALTRAARLLTSVVDDSSAAWARSPLADSTLVTERSAFLADLEGLYLESNKAPATALSEALVIADPAGRQHGKMRLISVRDQSSEDAPPGVTILDGARAASRLGQLASRSVVVLLDHAELDEEVLNGLNRFVAQSIDYGIYVDDGASAAVLPPASIDAFAFALPESRDVAQTRS